MSPGKWSDFVEMRKFFDGPTKCSKSLPCINFKPMEKSSTNLSLGWQLAKQPQPARLEGGFDEFAEAASSGTKKRKNLRERYEHEHRRYERQRKGAQREPKTNFLPKVVLMDANDYAATFSMPRREVRSDLRWRHQQQHSEQNLQQLQPEQQEQHQQQQQQAQQQLQQLQQLWKGDQRYTKRGQRIPDKPRRPREVPLCERPTIIMCPNHHAAQQYQEQLQYQLQLEQQEQYQQELYQNPYGQFYGYLQHARQQPIEYEEYSVPQDNIYIRSHKGRRYVGNYYYR